MSSGLYTVVGEEDHRLQFTEVVAVEVRSRSGEGALSYVTDGPIPGARLYHRLFQNDVVQVEVCYRIGEDDREGLFRDLGQ